MTQVPEGEIYLPEFYEQVKTLAQTVDVDYYMPGCPPVVEQVWTVLNVILEGKLPPKGSVIGVDPKTNCDECPRTKVEPGMRIKEFKRPHEVELDPDLCFLAQGVLCCGPATRAGCGRPCIEGNMPCRGCYGPPDGVTDQGTKLLSAIGALIDTDDPETLDQTMDSIVDVVGTFYRFSLADSILSELKYKV
jgi:F420-non-reducing hydrogenase small subunit